MASIVDQQLFNCLAELSTRPTTNKEKAKRYILRMCAFLSMRKGLREMDVATVRSQYVMVGYEGDSRETALAEFNEVLSEMVDTIPCLRLEGGKLRW